MRSFPLAAFVFMNALRPPLIGRPPLLPPCSRGAVGQGEKAIKRNRALPPSLSLSLRCSAPLTFFSVSVLPPPPVAAATTAAVCLSLTPRTLSTECACNLLYGYFCRPPSRPLLGRRQGGFSLYKVRKMGSKSLTILQLFFDTKFY